MILDDVSFPLGERCLLGVIGPSGAGKSTLLGALTGIRPATEGSVLYDGRDLYANYAELRHRIGLVPQENILHTQLSARRALGYAAELRFPRDTSPAERDRRIDEVLGELSLTEHADTRASSLSGGQQKRVNVALELLTKPSLLFLDEPTSGLDPGLDMSVMEMMSDLAHDGRTVIVVTHSVANLDVCDRLLVLVPGGKVAYFGPPARRPAAFRPAGLGSGLPGVRGRAGPGLGGRVPRLGLLRPVRHGRGGARPARCRARPGRYRRRPSRRTGWPSCRTLVRRYVAVIASDRNYVGVIALLPVILGALIRVIPDPGGLTGHEQRQRHPGAADPDDGRLPDRCGQRGPGAGEGTGDLHQGTSGRAVRRRLPVVEARGPRRDQRRAGGRPRADRPGRPAASAAGAFLTSLPLVEIMLAMAVLAVASMTAGLLISAVVNSSDKTMPLLVVVVLVQVVLSGAVFRLNGKAGLEQFSWLSPSRWGLGATASTIDLNQVTPPPPGNTAGSAVAAQRAHLAARHGDAGGARGDPHRPTWWRLYRVSPGRRR